MSWEGMSLTNCQHRVHVQSTSLFCLKWKKDGFMHLSFWHSRCIWLKSLCNGLDKCTVYCRLSGVETARACISMFCMFFYCLWKSAYAGYFFLYLQLTVWMDEYVICISSDCLCREVFLWKACLHGQKHNTGNAFLPRSINSLYKYFTVYSCGSLGQCTHSKNGYFMKQVPFKNPPTSP